MNIDYSNLFLGLSISLIFTFIILKVIHPNLKNFIKIPIGPQTIHFGNISRLGGVSIFLTMLVMSFFFEGQERSLLLFSFVGSIPVFVFGVLEDITQSVSPKLRLFGSILSGALFILIFDMVISRVEISLLDWVLDYKVFAILFTLICVTYLIQAFNIIDGLNGLALGTAQLIFLAIAKISYDVQVAETLFFSMIMIFILTGVFIFNFPLGKIFIGDSGSYIIGLYVSLCVITLINKNLSISPFVIVQMLIYPSYELFRSFIRRILIGKSVLQPDKQHLHSILYIKNLSTFLFNNLKTNIITSMQIMFLQIINFVYIINFYRDKEMIIAGIIIFIITFEITYMIINYKIHNNQD